MGELHSLAGQLEDLRAGCPMQGCRAGKEGELSALWRHWALLCRGVGLLLAHSEQRRAEWRDIHTSVRYILVLESYNIHFYILFYFVAVLYVISSMKS